MRTLCILVSALVGALLGGAAADLFLDTGAKFVSLETILVGAVPGALVATWLAWRLCTLEET